MDRIQALADNPLRVLGVLAAVLAAVALAVGSGANFTAQTANPNNSFSSGLLAMSNSKENAAILSATGMKPGDTETGTVDIENTGTVSGTFSLSRTDLVDSNATFKMSEQIDLEVVDCGDFSAGTPTCDVGDTVLYSGTLAAMTGSTALGTFDPADEHRYEFTATFDSSAGNDYQGESTSATFQWDATS